MFTQTGSKKRRKRGSEMDSTACLYKKKSLYLYIYKNIRQKSLFFQLLGIKYTGYILDIKYL